LYIFKDARDDLRTRVCRHTLAKGRIKR
jgi:hypothetical protein